MRIEKMSAAERPIVGAIVEAIRSAEEVTVRALAEQLGYRYDMTFRRAWNSANTILHAEGGGFVPKKGAGGGHYVKASTKQKIGRAQRFRAAAARKVARQHVSLAAADPAQLPEIERPAFASMVERNGALASRAISLLTKSSEVPKLADVDVPRLPRGR